METKGPILVIDDDPDFVDVVRSILHKEGYRVLSAPNGTQGLEVMRKEHPAVVLLDIMMSTILDGVTVSQAMREDPDLRDIPVIMISSIANSEHAGEFPTDEYIHLDYWLSKPVDPQELLRKVKAVMERYGC